MFAIVSDPIVKAYSQLMMAEERSSLIHCNYHIYHRPQQPDN